MHADSRLLQGLSLQLRENDRQGLLALVRACPEAPSWPQEAWNTFLPGIDHPARDEAGVWRAALAVRQGNRLSGIVAFAMLAESTELELLLVHPEERRRGLGALLTRDWLRWAEGAGASEAVLEVRATNTAAQALYRSLGFLEQGWRVRYYTNPVEDALLMRRVI